MSSCCGCANPKSPEKSSDPDPQAILWLKLGIAILLSGLTMYLSLGANLGNPLGTA
jgi:hypothetical protein